jgi:hypothetical protein
MFETLKDQDIKDLELLTDVETITSMFKEM